MRQSFWGNIATIDNPLLGTFAKKESTDNPLRENLPLTEMNDNPR